MSKAISIGYISKVSVGNVNASHTEGNVMVTKKVTLPDGTTVPYISGQAIRRMIRDRLEDLGEKQAESEYTVKKGQEVTPIVQPWKYIDEDLFGYLDPSGAKRRTSPVRVSAAVGLFPFRGDRDLGTRSFEKFGVSMEGGGNMFETEVYQNMFKGGILIELDRIGEFKPLEIGEKEGKSVDNEVKNERVSKLMESIKLLWGGGRTSRMLVDVSPKFFAYARLSAKHPVFLENLDVEFRDSGFYLKTDGITSALEKVSEYLENVIFGMEKGIFANEDDTKKTLEKYGKVASIGDAIDLAKQDVDEIWKS
jgi:CRISPR-associated protein Cst2